MPCRVVAVFASMLLTSVLAVGQKGTIYYTGQLDGFAGSWTGHRPPDWYLDRDYLSQGAILLGLGDNLAPDPTGPSSAPFPERIKPTPSDLNLDVVKFLAANYDAVVPGKQDFIFGANFLKAMAKPVKMVANNLVVQFIPPSTCAVSPSLTPTPPYQPNQVSLAISSGSGAAGGSGGKGGKGGKGGGGSSGGAGGGASAGSGGGGSGAAAGCTAGVNGPEHKRLSAADSKRYQQPKLKWPSQDEVYPWTSQFTIEALDDPDQTTKNPYKELWLCQAEQKGDTDENEDPETQKKACTPIQYEAASGGKPGDALRYVANLSSPAFTVTDLSGQIPAPAISNLPYRLFGGTEGRLCYFLPKKVDGTFHVCSDTFTVQTPLFDHAWRIPDRSDQYVIFGSLAPDTLNGVADTDKSWLAEAGTKVQIQVGINDPTSAILQALATYDMLRTRDGLAKRYGVVLAQMSQGEARELADDLAQGEKWLGTQFNPATATKISLVLSEADRYDASLKVDLTRGAPDPDKIPVFTPAPLFGQKDIDCLNSKEEIHDGEGPGHPNVGSYRSVRGCLASVNFPDGITIRNAPADPILPTIEAPMDASTGPYCAVNDKADFTGFSNPPSSVDDWECRVLNQMRLDTSTMNRNIQNGTDIAILEEKDFDFVRGKWNTSSPDKTDTSWILWKAGRLARVSLLGSTLTALLKQNDTLEKKTFQSRREVTYAEQLKVAGIYKDPGGEYYVNGLKLVGSQIYSVATSDQLANSTSDYPQLAQKDLEVPALYPIIELHTSPHLVTVNIADIGAQALRSKPVMPPTTFDVAKLEAHYFPIPPVNPASAKSSPPAYTYSNREGKGTGSAFEDEIQNRPFFHVAMQQLAFSYALNRPNQTSASIGANLSGVTNPNVSSPYSRSWSLLHGARLEWYEPHARSAGKGFPWFEDIGVDTQVNMAKSLQGSLTSTKATETTTGAAIPVNSLSITGNTLGFSPFIEFHSSHVPDWKPLVTRFLYSRNAFTQPSDLSGCAATSPTCDIPSATSSTNYQFGLSQATSSFWGGSAGTRYERSDFQYIEVGYLYQKSTNVLSALTFVPGTNTYANAPKCLSAPPGSKSYTCQLTGNETPTVYASGIYPAFGSSLTPSYAILNQQGAYVEAFWNYFLKHMNGILIQESIFGNYFAYGNRNESILTHYAFNSSSSVQWQLPANVTLGPTLSEFVYQSNAARGTQRSLTRMNAGIQVNYSFDWHTGVSPRAFLGSIQ